MKFLSKKVIGHTTFPDVVGEGAVVIFRFEVDETETHDVTVKDMTGHLIDHDVFVHGGIMTVTFKAVNNNPDTSGLGENTVDVSDSVGNGLTYSFHTS